MELQAGINRAKQLSNLKGKKDTEFYEEVVNWLEELQEFRKSVEKDKSFKGMTDTRLYHIYHAMKSRCYNAAFFHYKYYGGRGIKVCNEWLGNNGFRNFYNWAIRNGYDDSLTIDRIDFNGNYCPENCRWATWIEQANNRRKREKKIHKKRETLTITYKETTMTIQEWADKLGLSYQVISNRLKKGWSVEQTLETPLDKTHSSRGQGRKNKN